MRARGETTSWAAWAAVCVVVAAWGLRWLWGGEPAPGVDTTGHLTRLEVGLDLFASGRLDGWFDRAMLGYQTFLMYGPGLALAVGAVRLVTLGAASIPGAYEIVGVAAFAAVPFAAAFLARGLGLSTNAARVAGLVSLAVSSGRGGGIEGAFEVGLMPNHLAVPLVLVAWGLMVHARPRPFTLGAVVAAVAVTHPQSLVVLVSFAPLVLAAAWARGAVGVDRWRPLVTAAVVSIGLSAWWWYPAVVHRDVRGVLTSWDLPTFLQHLALVVEGDRGWIGWAATLVVASWIGAVAVGIARRSGEVLVLAALPVLALALLHAAQWALEDHLHEVVLFPNRGLAYAAYLAAPVVGLAADAILGRHPAAALLATAAIVAISIGGLAPPSGARIEPVAGLSDTADTLSQRVGDGERFAYVHSPDDRVGVPAPGRWLGWRSERINLGPFGAEFAPGVGLTLLVFDPPDDDTVDRWVERVRPLAVTHLVVGDPATAAVLDSAAHLRRVVDHDPVSVWMLQGSRPVEVVSAGREHLVLTVDAAERSDAHPLPVGYSPGWSARVDGDSAPLGRTEDGRLSVALAPGVHRVELAWSLPPAHAVGRTVTLAVLVAAATIRWRTRDRRERVST